MDSSFFNLPKLPLVNGVATGVTTQQRCVYGKNLLINSTFKNGSSAWNKPANAIFENNECIFTSTAQYVGISQTLSVPASYANHIMYYAAWIYVASTSIYLVCNDGKAQGVLSTSVSNAYTRVSGLWTMNSAPSSFYFKLQDGRSSGWTVSKIKNCLLLDLTALFGVGKEPTLAKMNSLLNSFNTDMWFDGTVKLSDDIITYTANTPSPDYPSPLVNAITAGTYCCKSDGNEYKTILPEMRSLASLKDTYDVNTKQFTRRVGTKQYNGNESFSWLINNNTAFSSFYQSQGIFDSNTPSNMYGKPFLCSHAPYGNAGVASYRDRAASVIYGYSDPSASVMLTSPISITGATQAAFKAWLAAQYAAGTPVTIYYQLATPVVTTIEPELVWEAPVTDRVEADCVYGNPKGTLDAACLNRIDLNIRYIKAAIDYYHVATEDIVVRNEEWLKEFYFKLEDMSRMQSAILNCYNVGLKKPSSPVIILSKAEDSIDYILLNKMEQLLLDIKDMLDNMAESFQYCGCSYCGDFQIGGDL